MKNLLRKKTVQHILSEVETDTGPSLRKSLTVRDLTGLGIAAIIGAGIFSTIGKASFNGGPAVTLLFIFTAFACAFSALCYAEFASAIPISGSAYTYAYASFGELVAWIIGWDLLMEYAIGNIAVAISWSDYFTGFIEGLGLKLPPFLTLDYLSAYRAYQTISEELLKGTNIEQLPLDLQTLLPAYNAWINAPGIGSFRLIADVPALGIVLAITSLVFVGVQESKTASNIMVGLKLIVILLVIAVGAFYVHPDNWVPFAPNGFKGVMAGVSAVFFAYIGFDALSTAAEECKDPRRDLPRAMMYSLLICTVLYVFIALVLTGMVDYRLLNVGDPLAFAFKNADMPPLFRDGLSGIIAVSAIIAMSSVLLVFQMGQPRIWMSMSRDGLLPPAFAKIHPHFKTPYISTLLTGALVAIPSLFLNLTEVTDLSSIGTLFAFVLVSGGVLMQRDKPDYNPTFKIPYINGKWIAPALYIIITMIVFYYNHEGVSGFLGFDNKIPLHQQIMEKFPLVLFFVVATTMTVLSYLKNLSLIPVLGLVSCLYLMSEVQAVSWFRFFGWLLLGLAIYFIYGYKNSKLKA